MRVDGQRIAAIGAGLLVLLGVGHDDDEATADRLAAKLRALRIFPDDDGRMNEPLGDREVLCVASSRSWPTRAAATGPLRGAAGRERADAALRAGLRRGSGAQRGVFGAHMEVELVNDGPVTLLVEV